MERTDINRKQKDGHRFVPKWNQEQYLKITRLLDGWNVLRVTRVEPVAPTDPYVYDLIVPETNNFIAGCGGILVHNSGGQKSQIDLAYRLALVKRQAQRTTGGLGVLWIDEGFETQDAGDLPPLIELLREMERDYAQTFITTHVEGMKETFPAQVRVEGGDGRDSSVELVMA